MTYVTFDEENGDLNLALPPEQAAFHDELCLALSETFPGSVDAAVLEKMNRFVAAWIATRKAPG
jgi:hypothetical protein